MMTNIYLETLNIEWGQIDPKHNRRVKHLDKIEHKVKYLQATIHTDTS